MLIRYLLLILLTLAVPTAGFASVAMQHCRDTAATPVAAHGHQHEMSSMAGMSAEAHAHMHHATVQKTASGHHSCKCGCPCSGNCLPGSCFGSVGLMSNALLLFDLFGSKQTASAAPAHALAAHPIDRLRPPIG